MEDLTARYETLRLASGRPADRLLILRRGLGDWIAWTARREMSKPFPAFGGNIRSAPCGIAGILADILTDHPGIQERLHKGALR